jgi:hypothetical protein
MNVPLPREVALLLSDELFGFRMFSEILNSKISNFFAQNQFGHCSKKVRLSPKLFFNHHKNVVITSCFGQHKV